MGDFYFFPEGRRRPSARTRHAVWRVEAAIIAGLLGLFRLLPFPAARGLAGRLFARFGVLTERATRAEHNLRVVFPEAGPARLRALKRATFRHLGQAMAELAKMDAIWASRRVEFREAPGAVSPSPERPTVFVSAHVGGWETVPLIARRYRLAMPIIYAPERNPGVDRRLRRLRAVFGSELVASDGGIRAFLRALSAGKSVGLTADTRLDSGEQVPFFGEPAPTNTSPARLALRAGCDLVPVRGERLPGYRYRVTVYPPIRPSDPSAARAERVRDMSRQLNALFEGWIRAAPGQWLCLKHRWSKLVYKRLQIR